MIRILKHLRRILRHKFWVAYYCFQLGLYRQGILHDLSKFGWYEFSRSVKFYDDNTSPLNKEKENSGAILGPIYIIEEEIHIIMNIG